MTARLTGTFSLLVLLAAAPAAQKERPNTPLPAIAPLDLVRVLKGYAEGRFDEAVTTVARAGDEIGRNLRRHWSVTAQQWIDADPARRSQRMLAAAALALETEHVRAERGDWRQTGTPPCGGACVLDWAQLQLANRGAPDRAERAWYLAAAALAGGVRDWQYLHRPMNSARPSRIIPGLIDRAVVRFPDDGPLRLEQAIAAAGRFSVTTDGGSRSRDQMLSFPSLAGRGELMAIVIARLGTPETAADMFRTVVSDPQVGAEASLRLGYLHWTMGHDAAARDALATAAKQASDVELRYLAQFLLGWIAMRRGDATTAIPWLEAALVARPGSQSAALALASLELQRGNADKAHQIARTSLDERRADADPWRLFLYGHHPHWAARIAELRRELTP